MPTGRNQVRAETEAECNADYDQLGSGDDESENGSEEEEHRHATKIAEVLSRWFFNNPRNIHEHLASNISQ